MATRTMAKSNNGRNGAQGRGTKSVPSAARRPTSIRVADTMTTSRDFANFMNALMGDIVSGRIDARTANAACNAGGKLLRVIELEYRFGRKTNDQSEKMLQLT